MYFQIALIISLVLAIADVFIAQALPNFSLLSALLDILFLLGAWILLVIYFLQELLYGRIPLDAFFDLIIATIGYMLQDAVNLIFDLFRLPFQILSDGLAALGAEKYFIGDETNGLNIDFTTMTFSLSLGIKLDDGSKTGASFYWTFLGTALSNNQGYSIGARLYLYVVGLEIGELNPLFSLEGMFKEAIGWILQNLPNPEQMFNNLLNLITGTEVIVTPAPPP